MLIKKYPWLYSISALAAIIIIYYVSISIFGPQYAEVCSKGKYGPPDECKSWDVVTACVFRLLIALDEHNGIVAALASVLVAVFTGVLWFATDKLWSEAKLQRSETVRSADAAEMQTNLLALQSDILTKQHGLAHVQFMIEHRPRLILRDVFFSVDGDFESVVFELSNIGGSQGMVTGGFVALGFVSDPRQFKDMRQGNFPTGVDGAILEAGSLRQFTLHASDSVKSGASSVDFRRRLPKANRITNLDSPYIDPGPLFFFGALQYVDARGIEFGIERLSAFRREWKGSGFERTGNPDHEYAD